jgi:hypothetical protein
MLSIILSFLGSLILAASARDAPAWQYSSPDIEAYFTSLMQPDSPMTSCCGKSDAYYADKTDECSPIDGIDCALVAIITDDRDDISRNRIHRDIGTRISIPARKIRKPPISNPTEHNIVFIGTDSRVLCWEPVAGF